MEEKKQKILDVAKQLFNKYGLKSVTMDEIAKSAGVSKKTIYQHFKDKKDLIYQIFLYEIRRTEQKINKILSDQQLNVIDRSILVHNVILEMNRKRSAIIERDLFILYPDILKKLKEFTHSKMFRSIVENLEQGKREGLIRQELNSEIIAALQLTRHKALRESADYIQKYSNEQILKEVLIYHLYGITTDKGREYLKRLKL